ncbi:MAG: CHAD domain-containing protein [Pyrinomonadaceae bacterium]
MKASNIPDLDCGADVVAGARMVLCVRLEEMAALRDAALDWSDPEGVHDMRVASRRLRSAIRDFKPYLRRRHLRLLRGNVKEVADALGRVRDEDVAIAELEKLAAEAPAEVSAGVENLAAERRRRREDARASLVELIGGEEHLKIHEDCTSALAQAGERARGPRGARMGNPPQAAPSFKSAGRRIIAEGWEELREASESLYRPLDAEPLHRMRISAKRLRYALELFAPCWGERLKPFAKEIAGIQSSLGELHDCDVWIEDLGERLRAGRGKDKRAEETQFASAEEREQGRAAAVWLMRHFASARAKQYRAALATWHEWEAEGFAARLFNELDADTSVDARPETESDEIASAADAGAGEPQLNLS